MENFFEKMSTYNILNNLLPGVLYCFLSEKLWEIKLDSKNIVVSMFLYYFIGMVISRVGSILVENICKKIKIIVYVDYCSFIKATKKDEKIEILSETNNTYRTMIALCLLLLLTRLFKFLYNKCKCFSSLYPIIIIVLLLILFIISYRKQTKYIKHRTEILNQN